MGLELNAERVRADKWHAEAQSLTSQLEKRDRTVEVLESVRRELTEGQSALVQEKETSRVAHERALAELRDAQAPIIATRDNYKNNLVNQGPLILAAIRRLATIRSQVQGMCESAVAGMMELDSVRLHGEAQALADVTPTGGEPTFHLTTGVGHAAGPSTPSPARMPPSSSAAAVTPMLMPPPPAERPNPVSSRPPPAAEGGAIATPRETQLSDEISIVHPVAGPTPTVTATGRNNPRSGPAPRASATKNASAGASSGTARGSATKGPQGSVAGSQGSSASRTAAANTPAAVNNGSETTGRRVGARTRGGASIPPAGAARRPRVRKRLRESSDEEETLPPPAVAPRSTRGARSTRARRSAK